MAEPMRPGSAALGLVGDIGGTNARFALVALDQPLPRLLAPETRPTTSYGDLAEAAEAYLREQWYLGRPLTASIAVAGPVQHNTARLTNLHWCIEGGAFARRLRLAHASIINDYTALSLALPWFASADLACIGGPALRVDTATEDCRAVVGPGTGLGTGILHAIGGSMRPIASEAGHASFAPQDEEEIEICRVLLRRFGRVSNERILSGPGLQVLFGTLGEIHGVAVEPRSAAQIVEAACRGNHPLSLQTAQRFCAILGAYAGDVALIAGARTGVYLAGGILPRMAGILAQGHFRARFENKAPLQHYMANIPTPLIVHPYPGLLGAATHLWNAMQA